MAGPFEFVLMCVPHTRLCGPVLPSAHVGR